MRPKDNRLLLPVATAVALAVVAMHPAPARGGSCAITNTGANTFNQFSTFIGDGDPGAYGADGPSCNVDLQSLTVGAFSGDGTFTAENGAVVSTSNFRTAAAGTFSTGTSTISSGAQVSSLTDCEVSSVDGAVQDSALGVMTISGVGTSLSCGDELQVGYDGPGSLMVTDSATVTALRLTSAFEGPGNGDISVRSGAQVEITGSNGVSHTFGVRKAGLLDIDGGTLAFTDAGGGTLTTCTVGGQCSIDVRVANGGLLSSELLIVADNDTTVTLEGGTIETQFGLRMSGQSLLQGSGTISGPLDNRSDLLPGIDGIGRVDVVSDAMRGTSGDVSHARGATMEMEIAGDKDFDEVVLDGNLTLSGNVQVQFIDSYEPALGTSFAIVSANGTVTYDPFSVSISGLSSELEAETTVFEENGQVIVQVPEPAPSLMACAMFASLCCVRRLRRGES